MTLYFRPSTGAERGPPPLRIFDPTRTDGRWARILRALDAEGVRLRDIHHAVRRHDSTDSGRVEKHRTVRALFAMVEAGLARPVAPGFAITPAGEAARAQLDANAVREAAA